MALIEIDVLVAQAFGLALEQLLEIYRIYFPTMKQYDTATWYDQTGQIFWTADGNGLPGVGTSGGEERPDEAARRPREGYGVLAGNPSGTRRRPTQQRVPGRPRTILTRHFVGPFTRCETG